MRAEKHQLVFTLWKSCICFQVLGNVFARPLVVGVTLLSSEAVGEAPGLGAGDAQLLISNLWHHRGTQEEPLLFQGAGLMDGDTPMVRSWTGSSAVRQARPRHLPVLAWPQQMAQEPHSWQHM